MLLIAEVARKYRGRADVIDAEPGRMMALDLDAVEVAGRLTTVLSENGDGTTHLEVTLFVQAKGMLSTMFFPVVSDAVGRGLPGQVDEFARSFEHEEQ